MADQNILRQAASRAKQAYLGLENRAVGRLGRAEAGFRDQQIEAKRQMLREGMIDDVRNSLRESLGDKVFAEKLGGGKKPKTVEDLLGTEAGRAMIADRYGPEMKRGAFGQRGPMESIAATLQNRKVLRAGVVTGTVGAGISMTAAAQQLIALMDHMGQMQEQEARVNEPGQGKTQGQGMA